MSTEAGAVPDEQRRTGRPARLLLPLAGLALLALAAVLALAVHRHDAGALIAGGVAATWVAAALSGIRTPAPRSSLLLLEAVGALHLAAFAVSGWLAEADRSGVLAWAGLSASQLAFAGGFVALAALLATYPSGRIDTPGQRHLLGVGVVVLVLELVRQLLFSASVEPVAGIPAHVPTPWPTLGPLPSVTMPALLLLLAASVLLLTRRGRGGPVEDRRPRSWAAAAGLALIVMILSSPAGTAVLGDRGWSLAFLAVTGTVPFLLLAGLARWRLGSVDRYLVRLLSRGLLLVVVLTGYAVLAAVASRAWPVAVVVTLGAALVGAPALGGVERWGDRWLTGGRVRAAAELDALTAALTTTDHAEVGRRTTEAVRAATGASWCRLTVPGLPVATSGTVEAETALSLPVRAAGQEVGLLECGPRPGGWGVVDADRLAPVASHAALALRDARLSAELAERVSELAASRGRLVVAEETVRRQVERDLHDGVQQQLVVLLARLELARHVVADRDHLADVLAAAHDLAGEALHDLRALTAGIHPALLADHGLVAAVRDRAAQLPVAVTVDADPRLEGERFAPEVEGAAYFVVTEALTNVVKHSGASAARVVLSPAGESGLRVAVADEGSGAARYDGSGLIGLRDRVDALGGRFELTAVPGVGTTVVADLGAAGAVRDA